MKMEERVFEIIKELSGREEVQETDNLQDDVALDSLGMVTLLMEIEECFEIELEESDMNPFDLVAVSDVLKLVERYVENEQEEC